MIKKVAHNKILEDIIKETRNIAYSLLLSHNVSSWLIHTLVSQIAYLTNVVKDFIDTLPYFLF